MGLFSRMFGTDEQGEPPGSDESEQSSDLLTQWPFVTLSEAHSENTPAHPLPTQAREAPASEPPATVRNSVVRALQTIVVQTPAPAPTPLVVPTKSEESVDIELDLDWIAVETPVPAAARGTHDKEKPAKVEARTAAIPSLRGGEHKADEEKPAKAETRTSPALRGAERKDDDKQAKTQTRTGPAPHAAERNDEGAKPPTSEMRASPTPRAAARNEHDETPAKAERFRQLLIDDAPPLRELMIALTLAPVARRCLEQAKPALASLLDAARKLDQAETATLLTSLEAAASAAAKGPAAMVAERERDTLLATYAQLAQALPEAFDVRREREQREPLLVQYLLRQVPDVHQPTIDKLLAAGYCSLEALCRASAADLVKATHIDGPRAEAIAQHFHSYQRERAERAQERATARLRALLERLIRAQTEYERADAAEERTRKRSARNERRATVLQLNALLTQIGELELVAALERSSTERKIESLRRYLERTSTDARASLGGRR